MSSILDALNKLEQEKAAQQMAGSFDAAPATPEEAAAELLVEPAFRNRMPAFSLPWKPIAAALVLGIILISLTVVLTMRMVAVPENTVAAIPSGVSPAPVPDASAAPAETKPIPAPAENNSSAEPIETGLVHTYTVPVKAVPEETEARTPMPVTNVPAKTVAEVSAPSREIVSVQAPTPPPVKETISTSAPLPEQATPVTIPEPAPAPEPVAVAEQAAPVTAPEPAPEPVAMPEQAAPVTAPEPMPAPEPVAVAEPVVVAAKQETPAPPPPPQAEESVQTVQHPLPDARTLMNQMDTAPKAPPPPEPPVMTARVPALPRSESSLSPVLQPPPARAESGPVDINTLPRLSASERESFGLDAIRLNVLRPADKNQPDGLAIINLKKVYVGEMIPGTQARLIGVDAGAIGVELNEGGSAKQYRIPK